MLCAATPNAGSPHRCTAQAMSTTIFSKVDVSLNYACISRELFHTILCNAVEQVRGIAVGVYFPPASLACAPFA